MYRILRSGSVVVPINQKTLNSYHRIVSEHKEVVKLSSLLSSSINSIKRMVTTAMEQFYRHKYLWVEERSDVIDKFLAEERTVGDFQEQMQKYRNLTEMLNNEPDVVIVGPLSLHCGKTSSLPYSLKFPWAETLKLVFSCSLFTNQIGFVPECTVFTIIFS